MVPAKRLTRSTYDKMILGVCGGIAHRFGWDPGVVRIIAVISLFPLHLAAVAAYLVLGFLLPKDPLA